MIDLTPLEVRKKKGDFRRAMRGYDPLLVDDFLDLVADRLEELVRENMSLLERVGQQEQEVADYRDRERALTEALVSAQQMREELRRQAVREAELAKEAAAEEAAQLRAAVEEEARRLRAEAQQEVAQLRATVEEESRRLKAEAQEEAERLRGAVREPHDPEQLRELQARQEEFLANYRRMLERELTQLGALARTLGVPPAPAGAAEESPAVEARAAEAEASAQAGWPGPRPEPEPEPASEPEPEEEPDEELLEADVADEAALAIGATPDMLLDLTAEPFEPEPFEPEPFLPEPSDLDIFGADDVAEALRLEAEGVEEGATDTTEVSGAGSEAQLYDGIAGDESGDGVPGPIGFGEAPAPWEEPWALAPAPPDDVFDLGELEPSDAADLDEDDDDDPDTAALLRNAAAAGYRLSDDDIPDEPLPDDTSGESAEDLPEGDSWLPSLLDDDKE